MCISGVLIKCTKTHLLTFANMRKKNMYNRSHQANFSAFARIRLNTNYMDDLICVFWHPCCRKTIRIGGKGKSEILYLFTKVTKRIMTLYRV